MPLQLDMLNIVTPTRQVEKLSKWNDLHRLGYSDAELARALVQAPEPTGTSLPVLVPCRGTPEETFELLWKIFERLYPLYRTITSDGWAGDWDYENSARCREVHIPRLRDTSTHVPRLHWETLKFELLTDFDSDIVLPANAAHASAFMAVLYDIFSRDVGVVLGGYELDNWFASSLNGMYTPIVRDRRLLSMHIARRLLNTYVTLIELTKMVV